MIVYWSGCIASILVCHACMRTSFSQRRRWISILVSALPMIFIAALRYDVGKDYLRTYVAYFENVQQLESSGYSHLEILYHWLNVIVVWLHGDYVWVFAIMAVLFYLPVYARIFENSPYPPLSIFLIVGMCYCFVFFNAMRQMVGCAILLYSVRFIKERRFLPFLLCTALATGFHQSCVLFIAMYWIGRIRIRPRTALLIVIAMLAAASALALLLNWVVSKTKYADYLLSAFDTGETAYVMLAINAILLIFMSIGYRNEREYQLYYNLQLAALLVTIFSGKVVLMLRFLWMFGLPSIISLPMAAANLPVKDRERKLILSVVTILYFAYAWYTVGVQNSNSVLPYQTIFSRWM